MKERGGQKGMVIKVVVQRMLGESSEMGMLLMRTLLEAVQRGFIWQGFTQENLY